MVLAGHGRLQTLGARGYAEAELSPGDCLWFTPGIIHRLVNEGALRLLVVMANAGLPEAGDAVLTFPPEILADPAAYDRAATLPAEGVADEMADAARRRRDLAIEGPRAAGGGARGAGDVLRHGGAAGGRVGAGVAGAVAGGSARGRGGDRAPARPARRRGRGTPG
ncbi:MAG TPA: cupin domain-containing protein [Streptosporangiaceae bacterium]|nr:cupin domain-containing protein [Streptosporangiaceae bacterium]